MTKDIEEIVKKLRMVSNMINMGEKIRWGQETTLMDEAADMLEKLTQHHKAEMEIGVTLKRVGQSWQNWKEGKDEGYIYDEGYTFFEGMSRGEICYLLDEIESLTPTKTDKTTEV